MYARLLQWILSTLLCTISIPVAAADAAATTLPERLLSLAQNDYFMDMQQVAKAFELPELPDKVVWNGPAGLNSYPSFSAVYDPIHSKYGIRKIVFLWQPTNNAANPMLTVLNVHLDQSHCPEVATFEQISGQKAYILRLPDSHGNPLHDYVLYSFNLVHSDQTQTDILLNTTACQVSLNKVRT